MAVVLREVIPDGTQWGVLGEVLPDWLNLEFGQDLKTHSALTFDYANSGAHFNRLKEGMYVVPEVNGNSRWFDSYFYIQESAGSRVPGTAEHHTTKFAGYSLRKRLDKVCWMPAVGSDYADMEAFRYTNETPGGVIKAGVENYLSRARNQYKDPSYWISGIGVSASTKWKYRVDEIVLPTTSVNEIITKYQDLGIGTARFSGFQLNTAHYDWYVDDPVRDKTDEVQLVLGRNLKDAEYARTNDNIITALLVRGSEDPFREGANDVPSYAVQWVIADQSVINRVGYHEGILDVPDVSTPSTLKAIGQNYLRNHLEPRLSTTYSMVDNLVDNRTGLPLNTPNVLEDFQCGDSILIMDGTGAKAEKVYAVTLSYFNPTQSPNITLTLNDYHESWEVKFDQRLRRLGG